MAEANLLTQLYNDFITVLQQTVIKYNVLAEKNETLEMKKEADAYINAFLLKDKFSTYVKYEESIIAELMNLDRTYQYDIIAGYRDDNSTIPFHMRERFLLKQREYILKNYVEKNNYYRTLNGQPDYPEDPSQYVYVDKDIGQKYNIDTETPVHLLDDVKISLMENIGYMDKLIAKYPNKKYLKFLGTKKIDIVTARTAKNFAVLRIPYDVSDTLWDRFALTYEQCREYFMTCIYVTEMRETMEYYDNFIALCIMIMTIQQVIARVIKDTIERNFFDDYCVRTLFSVYGLPYYTYMDSGIKRQIVQDLNILVMNKGTNKVLYDIASILGYDRLKIYKYYLMKVQKFDVNGVPLVFYKDDPDPETGEPVLDYERMFDVYFQAVEFRDLDTYKSLLDPTQKRSYNEITSGDPFWYEDDDLFKEVYESEYNFVETKYLGVSIAYRLSRILFENVYLMKMIFEKKDEIPGIILALPKISPFAEVNLFDAICALCAMTCKQNGLKGEILMRPSAIMHVLGFNFEEDFEKIKQDILANPYLDDTLTRFFKDSSTYTIQGINRLYDNIVALYDEIVEKMSRTQSIEVYDAYRKLYESLYYTDENRKMFGIGTDEEGNEVYANTFLEYLEFANPDLAKLINGIEEDAQYTEYINHICQKVVAIIPQLKYFGIMAGRSETMEKMLVDLICFFKSYTTDMIGLNVLYIFDMKPELLLRLIDEAIIHKTIQPNGEWLWSHADHVHIHDKLRLRERFHIWGRLHRLIVWLYLFDHLHFRDAIHRIHVRLIAEDPGGTLYDIVSHIMDQIFVKDKIFFRDCMRLYDTLHLDEHLNFWDYISYIFKEILVTSNYTMFDTIDMVYIQEFLKEKSIFQDAYWIYTIFHLNTHLKFSEFLDMIINITIEENCTLYDVIDIVARFALFDKLYPKDSIQLHSKFNINHVLKYYDEIHHILDKYTLEERKMPLSDILDLLVRMSVEDGSIRLKDVGRFNTRLDREDILKFVDELHHLKDTLYSWEDIPLYDQLEDLQSNISIDEKPPWKESYRWVDRIYQEDALKFVDVISDHKVKYFLEEHRNALFDMMHVVSRFSTKETFHLSDSCKISYSE